MRRGVWPVSDPADGDQAEPVDILARYAREPLEAESLPPVLGLILAAYPGSAFGQTWAGGNSGPAVAASWWGEVDGVIVSARDPSALVLRLRDLGLIA